LGNILIIEDDPAVQKLLGRLLETLGHSFLTAGTSTEGIAFLEKERLDLILLDIMLSGATSGLRFLVHYHHLIKAGKIPEIPILVISAVTEKEMAGIAQAYPFVKKYFSKPFIIDELMAEIRKHLADGSAGP
jgi:CheY-like chemotaxis protein